MAWDRPLLTDSGGFQMVSLLKFAETTEEGVTFKTPFEPGDRTPSNGTTTSAESAPTADVKIRNNLPQEDKTMAVNISNDAENGATPSPTPTPNDQNKDEGQNPTNTTTKKQPSRMLLRPEDSITHQNNINSSIIMALDDVVSSLDTSPLRHRTATLRTLRWLDRCRHAHSKPLTQNLFPIVQGGLDTELGGLREICLAGFRARDADGSAPGYAIGGLAGGESKDEFWKVVDLCCRALPDDRPRYLMGVGYPLDLVVCTALGVDMYDCVYPTRTGRFGVALVDGRVAKGGTMRLKSNCYAEDDGVIEEGCGCPACRGGYGRGRLHGLLKVGNPVAATLITGHNLAYMMRLVRGMKEAIEKGKYGKFVREFVEGMFPKSEEVPKWVRDALAA